MKRTAFMPGLALLLLVVYGAFWTWQTPGWLRGPLTLAGGALLLLFVALGWIRAARRE